MSAVTGTNLDPGSPSELIWWGTILCLTGIGAIIGIPMIIAGLIQQGQQGSSSRYKSDLLQPLSLQEQIDIAHIRLKKLHEEDDGKGFAAIVRDIERLRERQLEQGVHVTGKPL